MRRLSNLLVEGVLLFHLMNVPCFAGYSPRSVHLESRNSSSDINNSQQKSIFRRLGIPLRFMNYWKKSKNVIIERGSLRGRPYAMFRFDLDGDGKDEIRHRIDYPHKKYPSYYWFDLNEDDEIQEGEILNDPDADGLDGVEKWGD